MRRNLPLRFVVNRVGEPNLIDYGASQKPLDSAEAVVEFWRSVIATRPEYEQEKEHLIVVIVGTKLHPIGYNSVSIGTLNETIAHPREIFRPIIAMSGYGFILGHNHPSGDPTPSGADRRLTRQIKEGADILQLHLLDHIIVGHPTNSPGYYSFREAGVI